MADDFRAEVTVFAQEYASLFSSPLCSSAEGVAGIAGQVGKRYVPGVTFFTNDKSQDEAARLIEREMRKNIDSGVGTHLELLAIEKIDIYSSSLALAWLQWAFHPKAGSKWAGRDWTFTNIYAYRTASAEVAAGWEFVVRDHEVNSMIAATGMDFSK
ncbi:hypothetical protein BAUCODRAFT_20705 [Baudoinia panamericana UAMH 10762]|uniref:SnoaL-like domain-containing protein n=1 Tax=Baudoinia panamericana (strain UAMH 10762) TaxID=717646 RepID=M2M0U4_BAUPA|nr:uncharacterized protein BAUCODRAFT_20705 [Baudoinia panamericana UAMH 10762]EMD00643.1 hypothetical protein BAUCODRAFT_20705 [Baudoinia panamericana UAMH 10762]